MKHGHLFALAFSLITVSSASHTLAAPKKATAPQKEILWDWWFVWTGGDSPKREIIYIDSLSVETIVDHAKVVSGNFDPRKKPPVDYVQADVVAVFEDAKKQPARINARVRVKCDTMQMMRDTSYWQYWQAERFEKKPPTPWFPVTSDVKFSRMYQFLCEPKMRTSKNMMMRVDQTDDPLNITWAKLWDDVPRPKFTTKKTLAQAQADFNRNAAQAQATIDGGTKAFTEKRAQILRDEKQTAMEQRALFGKMRSKASPLMHSWLGAEERALVGSWGVPSSSYSAPNARFLTYTYGYASQMVDEQGNVQPGSRQEFYCDMTFEVRGGKIADYRSGGNYCGTSASGKARGPN